jgi:hypothetical protein
MADDVDQGLHQDRAEDDVGGRQSTLGSVVRFVSRSRIPGRSPTAGRTESHDLLVERVETIGSLGPARAAALLTGPSGHLATLGVQERDQSLGRCSIHAEPPFVGHADPPG